MEIDGDRLNPASSPSLPFRSLLLFSSLFYFFFEPNGDRWRGAPALGSGRLIIDQEDRDGSRGGEDTGERWRSGRNSRNLCFHSGGSGRRGGGVVTKAAPVHMAS